MNINTPRISVLMPLYNSFIYLKEAIDSVLVQDFSNLELVISDDCSSDETCNYLDTLSDPRIRIYKQNINLGIFNNLNFLIKVAKAPVAKILCGDDYLLPSSLCRIAEYMEANLECAVCRVWALGDADKFSKGRHQLEGALPKKLNPEAAKLAFATFGCIVGNLSKATIRPKKILEVGGFNQSYPYAGDWEGWIRVSERFGLHLLNEELIFERSHANQNSNLLNKKNELFPQVNLILTYLNSTLKNEDHKLLLKHWTIHFLSTRLSKIVRTFISGEPRLAIASLIKLPLGISLISVLWAYPAWKLQLPIAKNTTYKLFIRINNLNK